MNRAQWAAHVAKLVPFYYSLNPKRYARNAVRCAMGRGDLVRGPCELEGQDCLGRIEAHHDSYEPSQWLVVRWLCVRHHRRADRRRREAA